LEVGIKLKTAFATKELRLRLAIAPVSVAASVAPLRSFSRVYSDNLATNSLSFVFKEALESSEAPRVKPTLGFPTRGFALGPDVSEIFHNDSCSWLNAVKDRSGDNVVTILSESKFSTSEASKMPLGRLSALGLQSTLEAQVSFGYFCHMPIPMKSVIGSHSRAGNSEVNSNSLPIRNKLNVRDTDYDVKTKPVLLFNKVSRCRRATNRIFGILRKFERYLHPSTCCRHADNAFIPVHFERMQVISGRAISRLRAGYLTPLLYQYVCGLQRFGGFSYCLYVQVGDKVGKFCLARMISKAMQVVGIGFTLLPANATDVIKRLRKLLNCLAQSISLFWRSQKSNPDCSVHTYIIPHLEKILQLFRKEVCCDSSAT
jgi:hypothetical protein